MNFPRPDDDDDDMAEYLFTGFLADQKSRLSPEIYLQYVRVIELFDFYLDRYYRPDCSRREYDSPAWFDGRLGGFPPAVDLIGRFSVFLDDFLPREIEDGAERLRAARKVIKALGSWLIAEGYVVRKETARRRTRRSKRPPYLPGFLQD